MRLLDPEDIPSRYCVTVCFVSLSAAQHSRHQWRLVSEIQVIVHSATFGEKHFGMVAQTSL